MRMRVGWLLSLHVLSLPLSLMRQLGHVARVHHVHVHEVVRIHRREALATMSERVEHSRHLPLLLNQTRRRRANGRGSRDGE